MEESKDERPLVKLSNFLREKFKRVSQEEPTQILGEIIEKLLTLRSERAGGQAIIEQMKACIPIDRNAIFYSTDKVTSMEYFLKSLEDMLAQSKDAMVYKQWADGDGERNIETFMMRKKEKHTELMLLSRKKWRS